MENIDGGNVVGGPSKTCYYVSAFTLVLYMVLVPGVLFTAPGVPVSK